MFCVVPSIRACLFSTMMALVGVAPAATQVPVRFRDSATGFAVQPDVVESLAVHGRQPKRWTKPQLSPEGRERLALERGRHRLTVTASNHRPMSGELQAGDNPYRIEFNLDPTEAPREIQPETLATLHRVNETLFVGYVSDDETGQPLAGVSTRAEPGRHETRTDGRGFFRFMCRCKHAQRRPPRRRGSVSRIRFIGQLSINISNSGRKATGSIASPLSEVLA